MVPSYIIVLNSFPIASSGKIDREALPPPSRRSATGGSPPAIDDRERELLAIWQEVLNSPKIGIETTFLVGGESPLGPYNVL